MERIPMKILYSATVLSHICQFHLPYLQALQERGHVVHVAAHDNLAVKNGLALKYADRFIEIPFQRSPKSPDNIRAYRQLKKLIDAEKYDQIVCNTPMGGIVTRLAAKGSGARVIYIAHGFHFFRGASKTAWMVYYPIEKRMARYCDTLVTINEEDYALARKDFPVRTAHIRGVGVRTERYHPVGTEEADEMRRAEGLNEGDFVILCTGELNQNKDQKTLVSAAALLRDRIPNLKVLLAGNGPTEQALREQIAAEHLDGIVKLLGYRTDLEKVAPAADLIVSCSHREGLGLNVIEGMLCRKPVVASINRGHNELIDDGVNGYLVQPGDVQGFSDRIRSIYDDAALAHKMGIAGLQKAQAYTVNEVKKSMMAIIEEA